jgi:GNAT superfamily N-acetyltransferase
MLESMFRSMRSFWLGFAEASRGGSSLELAGVYAAIMPAMPDRSVVNCVVHDGADALEAALDRLAAAYEGAGVQAWTVWVHETDEPAQAVLSAAGHVLDAAPMGQERELDGIEAPGPDELDLLQDPSPGDFDPIVSASYGWPGFARAIEAFPAQFHAYVARHEGRPAACLGIWDVDGDAHVQLVGTAPEARGHGLAPRLMRRALVDARERGCTVTRLQATAMGYPVYSRLGYRDLGRVQMWERRKPAPPE